MKNLFRILFLILGLSLIYCSDDNPGTDPDKNNGSEAKKLSLTPIAELNQGPGSVNSHAEDWRRSQLMMDFRSYIDIGRGVLRAQWPAYARIKRLSDGTYMLFYQETSEVNATGVDTYYATSPDLVNWTGQGFLFQRKSGYRNAKNQAATRLFTNAHGFVLSNGDLLAFASYRVSPGYTDLACHNDNGIIMMRSTDNGKTWSDPQEIYHGPNWEAIMLQLPSGELQCYFSESRPSISGGHSGTSMVVSNDNGRTWSPPLDQPPYRVIRQHWYNQEKDATFYTDQMAGVIKLNNSNKLAVALESAVSYTNDRTTFGISFAYTDDSGVWKHLEGDELGPDDRQNYLFSGAGPSLLQFPSGESVVSYGLSSHHTIRIGDAGSREFGAPFVALPGRGSWGTIELNDDHSLIAAMRNSEDANNVIISLTKYILNHRIKATNRKVTIDGDNAEWKTTDDALFVGSKSQAQATLRCAADNENIYFLVEVLDEDISKDDYVNILFSPNTPDGKINSEARRIRVSHAGFHSLSQYAGGGWRETTGNIQGRAAYDGTISNNSDVDNGYLVEISIPRSEVKVENGELLVNLLLIDMQSGEDAIVSSSSKELTTWIPVTGL